MRGHGSCVELFRRNFGPHSPLKPCAFHSRRPPLPAEPFHNGSRQAMRFRKSKAKSPSNEIPEVSKHSGVIAPDGGAPSPTEKCPRRLSPPGARKHRLTRERQRGVLRSTPRAGSVDLCPRAEETLAPRGRRCQRERGGLPAIPLQSKAKSNRSRDGWCGRQSEMRREKAQTPRRNFR